MRRSRREPPTVVCRVPHPSRRIHRIEAFVVVIVADASTPKPRSIDAFDDKTGVVGISSCHHPHWCRSRVKNLSRTRSRPSSLRGPHASARDRAGWSVEAPFATMAERFGFETGKLMMSQFRSRTRIGRKKRLLEEAEKILRSGAVEQPKWFNALKT